MKIRITEKDCLPFDWAAEQKRLNAWRITARKPSKKPDVATFRSKWDGDYPDAPPSGMDYEDRPTPYSLYSGDSLRPLCDVAHALATGTSVPAFSGGKAYMPKVNPFRLAAAERARL